MKKLLFLTAALTLAFMLQPADNVQAAEDAGQVAICHYHGHEGLFTDFVITGFGGACFRTGGDVLIVGQGACERGHDTRGDCGLDIVDQVRNGPFYRGN